MVAAKNSKSRRLVPVLLDWFAANARDLPWRHTRDPYAIWVSEIMLQQTQVKTVLPYWDRWMRGLPTIEALAGADSEKIHKLWEGLGYYTRVRNMQKAARQILEKHGGKFPVALDEILALPGIGRYTAGAICSIVFNQPTPILDGNVIRVLTRIFGIATDPRERQTSAQLWQLANELVHHASRITDHSSACSLLNQSLMELGALICTPRQPKCPECPVKKHCVALRENRVEQLPRLGKRMAVTERRFSAFVVECDGKFFVRQRPAGVVNAHLWEFPNVEVSALPGRARHSVRADARPSRNGAQRTDGPCPVEWFKPSQSKRLCTIKHSITRYRITLEAYRVGAPASGSARKTPFTSDTPDRRPALQGRWLTISDLKKLSFPSAHKKIVAALADAK